MCVCLGLTIWFVDSSFASTDVNIELGVIAETRKRKWDRGRELRDNRMQTLWRGKLETEEGGKEEDKNSKDV